jgi:hypothetical protein
MFGIVGHLVRNLQTELLQIPDGVLLDCAYRERFLWVLGLGRHGRRGEVRMSVVCGAV